MTDIGKAASRRPPYRLKPMLIALASAGLSFSTAGYAATITVTNNGDAGSGATCTLRQAVVAANTNSGAGSSCTAGTAGADTIVFGPGITSPISLVAPEITVTEDLTITGPGAALLSIVPQGTRIFNVTSAPADFALEGLTLTQGVASTGNGGCVLSAGNVLLENSVVTGCTAASGTGGGISANGILYVSNSTVSGNTSAAGGGITGYYSVVRNSTISGNAATAVGGGVLNLFSIIGNSTISGNSAPDGAAIAAGAIELENSTVFNNTAGSGTGAGVKLSPFGPFSSNLTSTIVAGTISGIDVDCTTPCTLTGDHDLVRTHGANATLPAGTLTADPLLGPLANNGGPTLTHLPAFNSPVIDAGSNPASFTTDQRGAGFPRIAGLAADIGAVEASGTTAGVAAVPTLSPFALAALSGVLGFLGWRTRRKRNHAGGKG